MVHKQFAACDDLDQHVAEARRCLYRYWTCCVQLFSFVFDGWEELLLGDAAVNLCPELDFINEESYHWLKQFFFLSDQVFVGLQFDYIQIDIRSDQIALSFPYKLMLSQRRLISHPNISAVRTTQILNVEKSWLDKVA